MLTAAVLCFATFFGEGGLDLRSASLTEIALTLAGGIAAAAAILLAPRSMRPHGAWPSALLFAFTALTAISVAWSVAPDASWQYAGRMLAYSAVFGACVLLAAAVPRRWQGVLAGVLIAAVVVCAYAVLEKIFPAQLDRFDTAARLRGPFAYWNATGLMAGMGIIACLWLGTRRHGHALANALAYPAAGLLAATLMLAYSRGALAVTVIGAAIWLILVPRRLRGALMLAATTAGTAIVVAFAFSSSALSSESVPLAQRVNAGHQLGALLLSVVVGLLLAGIAIGFLASRRPLSPGERTRAGATLLALLAVALLAGVGVLATRPRGFGGTISHAFSTLTNPDVTVKTNGPGRLTAVASVRARYWKQAVQIFEAHPALGTGADTYATARTHYEHSGIVVHNAHGYIVQTLADLGVVGVAVTLALLLAWMLAAGAATHPFNRRWRNWRWQAIALPHTPERIGMMTMLCIVITFGLHSLIDWTWYVPGTACVALICAGWLAGRGPIEQDPGRRAQAPWRHLVGSRITPTRAALACAAVAAALLAAWTQWQPLRSDEASQEALALLPSNPGTASAAEKASLAKAQSAVEYDPLSVHALIRLSVIEQTLGEPAKARATLEKAVRQQPANPLGWYELGIYDLQAGRDQAAANELRAAYYLDREVKYRNAYVLALRSLEAAKSRPGNSAGTNGTPIKTAPSSRSRAGSPARPAHLRDHRS